MSQQDCDSIAGYLDELEPEAMVSRTFQVCRGSSTLTVLDEWESVDHMLSFGEILKPLLDALCVDPGVPLHQPRRLLQPKRKSRQNS